MAHWGRYGYRARRTQEDTDKPSLPVTLTHQTTDHNRGHAGYRYCPCMRISLSNRYRVNSPRGRPSSAAMSLKPKLTLTKLRLQRLLQR